MNSPHAQQIVQAWFDRIKTFVRALGRPVHPTEGATPSYGGLGWCDSMEQQLIIGIATHGRTVMISPTTPKVLATALNRKEP